MKKSRETERRRRPKQKKNKSVGEDNNAVASDDDNAKENSDPQKVIEQVEVKYIPEKAELYGFLDDEFRKVFEKFTFKETPSSGENYKNEDTVSSAALNKKASSDSDYEEEEQDAQQKDRGGIFNKKKKLQCRMKIAELK